MGKQLKQSKPVIGTWEVIHIETGTKYTAYNTTDFKAVSELSQSLKLSLLVRKHFKTTLIF